MNKEQAERALEMGQKYLRAKNPIKALKLFTKSKGLSALPGINTWIAKAMTAVRQQEKAQSNSSSSSSSSSSNSSRRNSTRPSGGNTSYQSSSSARDGTPRMRRAQSAPSPSSSNARPTDPIVIEVLGKRTGHYYDILGVTSAANESQIKKAYRKLALKLHPDRNTTAGAADAFKRIGEAYNVLSDSEKKAEFDRWGPPEEENQADGQQQQSRGPFGGRRRRQYHEHEIDPNDIFNAFFGGGFPRGHMQRQNQQGGNQNAAAEPINQIMRLLPLLLLFLFTFLQLPSSSPKVFSLDQSTRFYKPLFTKNRHIQPRVKYYVARDFNPREHNIENVEFSVERSWLDRLGGYCRQERQQQRYALYNARLNRNRKKIREIQNNELKHCNEYQKRAEQIQTRRL